MAFQIPADPCKGVVLALDRQHPEQTFQKCGSLAVNEPVHPALAVVGKGIGVRVLVPVVDLSGSHSVTEHLDDVAQGHFHGLDAARLRIVVRPVFKMVLVAPLVMQPRL